MKGTVLMVMNSAQLSRGARFGIISLALILILVSASAALAQGAKIKDIANVRGVRTNHLLGVGLVVGLSATGDSSSSLATNRAAANMLSRLGLKTDAAEVVAGNMAAVLVTASLPPFAKIGDRIDIQLSTVGDASSLAGGTLVMTPIKGGDSQVYAVAQGSVVTGTAVGSGRSVLTVASIPGGAMVEREFSPALAPRGVLTLSLKKSDFTTSANLAEAVNQRFKGFFAKSLNPTNVEVTVPPGFQNQIVEFVAELENIEVMSGRKAVVVMNERTGTVVMGQDVTIKPVAISHGGLSIRVGDGEGGEGAQAAVVPVSGTTVGDLMQSMNALGVKPADIVSILQAMHAAHAIDAELKFL